MLILTLWLRKEFYGIIIDSNKLNLEFGLNFCQVLKYSE